MSRQRATGHISWQLITTSRFQAGDIVLGFAKPVECSRAAWINLRVEQGWPSDVAMQTHFDKYVYDKSMPSFVAYHVCDGALDEDGEPLLTWRTAAHLTPPHKMPLYYFLDHSDSPTLVLGGDKLISQLHPDGRVVRGPVWYAAHNLPAGSVLSSR